MDEDEERRTTRTPSSRMTMKAMSDGVTDEDEEGRREDVTTPVASAGRWRRTTRRRDK
jgi:hypothetical protein